MRDFSGKARANRPFIPFRSVNRKQAPGYDPTLQRHHLLPRQLLSQRCFRLMFAMIDVKRLAFDDFRANGLLLPATEERAMHLAMPLHRGPHRAYNSMVIERVGRIEHRWSRAREIDSQAALEEALFRLELLQCALRTRLLAERRRLVLNRKDPVGTGFDFSELDAMAEALWNAT